MTYRRCSVCRQSYPEYAFSGSAAAGKHVCSACAVTAMGQTSEAGFALPCLNSNNSNVPSETKIEPAFADYFMKSKKDKESAFNDFSTSHMKSAMALELNLENFIKVRGLNHCGFLTLTFPYCIKDVREASRRFNSMNTGFLSKICNGYVGVFERHKSGGIHFHLVVGLRDDIRTGIDFNAIARRDYRSANPALRHIWLLLRENLPNYGFGRAELLPVKTNSKGLARYVSKYIMKAIHQRIPADKGFRLIRMSQDKLAEWKVATSAFSFNTKGSKKWRLSLAAWVQKKSEYLLELCHRKGEFFKTCDENTYQDVLSCAVSPHWAFLNRENIVGFLDSQPQQMAA